MCCLPPLNLLICCDEARAPQLLSLCPGARMQQPRSPRARSWCSATEGAARGARRDEGGAHGARSEKGRAARKTQHGKSQSTHKMLQNKVQALKKQESTAHGSTDPLTWRRAPRVLTRRPHTRQAQGPPPVHRRQSRAPRAHRLPWASSQPQPSLRTALLPRPQSPPPVHGEEGGAHLPRSRRADARTALGGAPGKR